MDVQYPYAYDEENNLVDISSISLERRYEHKYSCPNCGQVMRPRLGKIRAKCFYHFHCNPCGAESYIHQVGKELLCERFKDPSAPFLVVFDQKVKCDQIETCSFLKDYDCSPCTTISEHETIDLKEIYDSADIEKEYITISGKSFRPDILLSREKHPDLAPLFLEINYKHPCSESKIQSGITIIEFKVSSILDLKGILYAKVFSAYASSMLDSFPIQVYNLDRSCSRDEIIKRLYGKEEFIPCTTQHLAQHPRVQATQPYRRAIDRVVFYPSGRCQNVVVNEFEEGCDTNAVYCVSSYRNISISPRAIIACKDARFRVCSICSHYNLHDNTCQLSLNRPDNHNMFSQDIATTCNSFEVKESIKSHNNSFVEGKDYFVWINPLLKGCK